MSQLVLVSDIHGNAPALQAVVDREGLDSTYVVLGDIHGLLAQPQATLELVRQLGGPKLAGNHDKALFHKGEGHVNSKELSRFELEHTLDNLTQDDIDYMRGLPFLKVWTHSGTRFCATHAMPWPDQASGYEAGNAGVRKGDVTRVASVVADDYDYVFHGHTHEQYSLDCSRFSHDVHFVNPGSLGYADSYTVVSTDSNEVEHKSVEGEYDYDALKKHVQSVLPDGAPHVNRWI